MVVLFMEVPYILVVSSIPISGLLSEQCLGGHSGCCCPQSTFLLFLHGLANQYLELHVLLSAPRLL